MYVVNCMESPLFSIIFFALLHVQPHGLNQDTCFFFHSYRSATMKDEASGKYCLWCGQANEEGRTTCKRCGRPI